MSDSTTATFDCPWCERRATSRTEFRVHLMVDHRKRKLAEFVADHLETTSLTERDKVTASRNSNETTASTDANELAASTGHDEVTRDADHEETDPAADRDPEPVTL